jgi:hypothetical protein
MWERQASGVQGYGQDTGHPEVTVRLQLSAQGGNGPGPVQIPHPEVAREATRTPGVAPRPEEAGGQGGCKL